ncbi:putative transcription factor MYB-HB-like family [Helianthus annuus]|nr:putative transcription factor MYB-HB-like family [Helianthus annuus]
MMSESGCWANGQNPAGADGSGEIMLFGVRVKVDPMRKSVSMNDLSQYVHVQQATRGDSSSNSNNLDGSIAVAADSGYASAEDAVRNPSNVGRERKRGVPWTEDEHKLFLLGLKKVGKGDWRGISRNFVKTRTPTQVASHAQKYFLRRSNLNRRRRRSSLFDITTDSVATIPMEEEQTHEDNATQPSAVGLIPSPPLSIKNQTETVAFNTEYQINTGPVPLSPTLNLSTRADNYSNREHERDSLSLSLSLNLSLSSSTFQAISGFNNGDGMISVV